LSCNDRYFFLSTILSSVKLRTLLQIAAITAKGYISITRFEHYNVTTLAHMKHFPYHFDTIPIYINERNTIIVLIIVLIVSSENHYHWVEHNYFIILRLMYSLYKNHYYYYIKSINENDVIKFYDTQSTYQRSL